MRQYPYSNSIQQQQLPKEHYHHHHYQKNRKNHPLLRRWVILFVVLVIGQLVFMIRSWHYVVSTTTAEEASSLNERKLEFQGESSFQQQQQQKNNPKKYNQTFPKKSSFNQKNSKTPLQNQEPIAVIGEINENNRKQIPLTYKDDNDINNINHVKNENNNNNNNDMNMNDPDRDCIFRNSPIYRSVFVYPSPGEPEWMDDNIRDIILTQHGKERTTLYPWQYIDNRTKTLGEYHYRIRDSRAIQYTTEILVREIFTNPNSCLRTNNPMDAKLFYIPYMASIEWHNGTQYPKSFDTSPYGQAIIDVIDHNNFTLWESLFGWTSTFWKRRNGADHVLVMSEPCHGLWHPRFSPGNFVYINAQKQLTSPIIISKDISRTFVKMYPKCSAKNIVMPHPNTDGRWFNSKTSRTAQEIAQNAGMIDIYSSPAALPAEKELAMAITTTTKQNNNNNQNDNDAFNVSPSSSSSSLYSSSSSLPRVLAQYYKAGKHGACFALRNSLERAYTCTASNQLLDMKNKQSKLPKGYSFPHAYRQATFCPCPGGDAPSAKRMFDALFAGCIPVILSHDFVWPFTEDIPGGIIPSLSLLLEQQQQKQQQQEKEDGEEMTNRKNDNDYEKDKIMMTTMLHPDDFSIRLSSFNYTLEEGTECSTNRHRTVQAFLETISASEIQRLRKGVQRAARAYSYYQWDTSLPDNPLQENILPNGGAAHALVAALAERAEGKLWPACQEELQTIDPSKDNVNQFKC